MVNPGMEPGTEVDLPKLNRDAHLAMLLLRNVSKLPPNVTCQAHLFCIKFQRIEPLEELQK